MDTTSKQNSYKASAENYGLSKRVDKTVPAERWIASLSNGETIFENYLEGMDPAWVRLSNYVKDNDLSITNLRLEIGGTTVKLPAGQQGYIQKKVAWALSNGSYGIRKCIGYCQDGLALIYEVDKSMGSRATRTVDPGAPQTIYRADIRKSLPSVAAS